MIILYWLLGIMGTIVGIVLFVWLYAFLVRPRFVPYWLRYIPVRILAPLVCWVCGVDVKIHKKELLPHTRGKKGYAIIANHQSMFDIVILAAIITDPISFVAKDGLKKVPFVNTWATTLRCPFIERDNLRQSYKAVMVEGAKNIEDGLAMGIFPSGTRSHDNMVQNFKAGSFKMATSIQAPILPISIADSAKSKKANFFNRVTAHVYIHPMVEAADYATTSSFELATKVQSMIAAPLKPYIEEDKEH